MGKQNGEILGPLEIDVSEITATTYNSYDAKKLQRENAQSLHHRYDIYLVFFFAGKKIVN